MSHYDTNNNAQKFFYVISGIEKFLHLPLVLRSICFYTSTLFFYTFLSSLFYIGPLSNWYYSATSFTVSYTHLDVYKRQD